MTTPRATRRADSMLRAVLMVANCGSGAGAGAVAPAASPGTGGATDTEDVGADTEAVSVGAATGAALTMVGAGAARTGAVASTVPALIAAGAAAGVCAENVVVPLAMTVVGGATTGATGSGGGLSPSRARIRLPSSASTAPGCCRTSGC